jgi:type VI secretion system secreted protein Hcp
MAVDGYMYFMNYSTNTPTFEKSESQVSRDIANQRDKFWKSKPFEFEKVAGEGGLFEIEDFSFDIEQTLNIGSQSTGIGAGKITFNPFSITRKIDRFSPILFERSCSGTPWQKVVLGLRKSSGGQTAAVTYLAFIFKMVGVKTISWSYDDESPKETTTFEYGGLQIHYASQNPNGTFDNIIPGGWNRVRNVKDTEEDDIKPLR